MKASEARALSQSAELKAGSDADNWVQNKAMPLIRNAAEKCQTSVVITTPYPFVAKVLLHLSALGYTVKNNSDQRDGDYLTISW